MLKVEKNGKSICLEAVVFDMDGLMYDSERVVMHAWDVAGEKLGWGPLGHNIYHTLGMGAELREQYFRKTYGAEFPYDKFKEVYREAFYEYADSQGVPLKPGLRELLELLQKLGIPAAMATSTGAYDAFLRLKKDALEAYFQAVVTGDMVTETKPSPEIYQKACRALNVEPSHAIALEDAGNGILSAYRAGMHPVMIPDLQKDSSAVDQYIYAKMNSLTEVTAWLAESAEWLDIVSENGEPTGETVERTRAHREGIRHRTSHVWLARIREGRAEILLQKRSQNKDSHPGCYDMSSGGHIPAGVDYLPSAVRELKEELGIQAQEDELLYCGTRRFYWEDEFHGQPFVDHQVSNVYLLWKDPEDFRLQKSEVEDVLWIDFEECCKMVTENSRKHCIAMEELELLKPVISAALEAMV